MEKQKETGRKASMMDNEGMINNFIYRKQFERKLNPIYLFFTKAGLLYLIGSVILYNQQDGGFLATVAIGFYGFHLYKNKFPYKYYQAKDLWLVQFFSNMINNKRKRAMNFNNIYPEFKFKNPLL